LLVLKLALAIHEMQRGRNAIEDGLMKGGRDSFGRSTPRPARDQHPPEQGRRIVPKTGTGFPTPTAGGTGGGGDSHGGPDAQIVAILHDLGADFAGIAALVGEPIACSIIWHDQVVIEPVS
jgi:hypothetical protein